MPIGLRLTVDRALFLASISLLLARSSSYGCVVQRRFLRLRAASNKSLDASGGSVFCNLLGAAKVGWNRAAASTQPFGIFFMLRQLSIVLFLTVLLSSSVSVTANPKQRTEKISGRIVAYQRDLVAHACFDSICGGSFLVRLDTTKPTYVRVDFAYADNTAPYESIIANKRWYLT